MTATRPSVRMEFAEFRLVATDLYLASHASSATRRSHRPPGQEKCSTARPVICYFCRAETVSSVTAGKSSLGT